MTEDPCGQSSAAASPEPGFGAEQSRAHVLSSVSQTMTTGIPAPCASLMAVLPSKALLAP